MSPEFSQDIPHGECEDLCVFFSESREITVGTSESCSFIDLVPLEREIKEVRGGGGRERKREREREREREGEREREREGERNIGNKKNLQLDNRNL